MAHPYARLKVREDFHEFSQACTHRKLIDLGDTGYHACMHVDRQTSFNPNHPSKIQRCEQRSCPRIVRPRRTGCCKGG